MEKKNNNLIDNNYDMDTDNIRDWVKEIRERDKNAVINVITQIFERAGLLEDD